MDYKTMEAAALEERLSQIVEEATEEKTLEELKAYEEEQRAIKAELEERKAAEAERRATAEAIATGVAEVTVKETIEEEKENRTMSFGRESKEYRDAFMAALVDRATTEQRAILADNTAYGDGLSLPIGMDREVWDQVNNAHPILRDIEILRTGIAIKVTKMTPAAVTKKMDSAASSEQTFTSAEVVLVGADYHTYVNLSYAEAKMSQEAMERFLVKEVADALGDALAKDVFARVLSDAGVGQKVTSTSDMFADVKSAMGLAVQATRPVIYAPAADYYNIVGAITSTSGYPFNIGSTLGCEVKLDNAATKVTILDPSMFVLNMIQDTIVESERDVKNAQFVIGSYMRAEGCLRKTHAAAYID